MPDARLPLTVAVLFLLGGALLHLTHRTRGVPGERRRRDWLKYWIYVALINALWLSAYLGVAAAGLLLAVIAVSGTIEVFRITRAPYRVAAGVAAGLAFPAALAHLLLPPAAAWQARFAFVVIVTASTDSFAEITGRLLGRRKLCPRLSPGKTVEGLGGALLMAVAVAWALGFLVPGANGLRLPLLGLLTAVAAVFGDLLFSAVKRAAGIKDFSRALPGHGGVLDRFDSLLLAAPVFYWSCALLLE